VIPETAPPWYRRYLHPPPVSGYSQALNIPDARGPRRAIGVQLGARYWLSNRIGMSGQIGVGDIPGFFGGAMLRW
jgi:hypothetical protein